MPALSSCPELSRALRPLLIQLAGSACLWLPVFWMTLPSASLSCLNRKRNPSLPPGDGRGIGRHQAPCSKNRSLTCLGGDNNEESQTDPGWEGSSQPSLPSRGLCRPGGPLSALALSSGFLYLSVALSFPSTKPGKESRTQDWFNIENHWRNVSGLQCKHPCHKEQGEPCFCPQVTVCCSRSSLWRVKAQLGQDTFH